MLLVAMGLQAITPDPCDLCSPWLLGLLVSAIDSVEPVDSQTGSMPWPGSADHDDGGPGAPGLKRDLTTSLRVRLVEGSSGDFVVLNPTPRVSGTTGPRAAIRSTFPIERWADGLIPVLCRFLC